MTDNFSARQLETISTVVKSLYEANTAVGSAVKNKQIELYKDGSGNCYISFLSTNSSVEETTTKIYLQIDTTGQKWVLNNLHDEFYLVDLFAGLERIKHKQ